MLKVTPRHVAICPGRLAGRWKLKHPLHSGQSEHGLSIGLQSLVFPHHVVVDQAGVAEGVHPLPVLVERFLPLRPRVHKILDKLRESHIISFLEGFRLGVGPVPADDFSSVAFVEGSVVPAREFVSVG